MCAEVVLSVDSGVNCPRLNPGSATLIIPLGLNALLEHGNGDSNLSNQGIDMRIKGINMQSTQHGAWDVVSAH